MAPSFSAGAGVVVRPSLDGSRAKSTEFFGANVFGVKALDAVSQIATAPNSANNVPGAAFFMKRFAKFQVPRISRGWALTRLINSL
jgi:hypothetical protein